MAYIQFPNWQDDPPEGFPFRINLLTSFREKNFKLETAVEHLQTISERGIQLLKSGHYVDALWKLENCLLICECNQPCYPQEIVRYVSSFSTAAAKLIEHLSAEESSEREILLDLCYEYCKLCFGRVPSDSPLLEKLHYWSGESLRLQKRYKNKSMQQQKNDKDAIHHFEKSYDVSRSPTALSRIIIMNQGMITKKSLKIFNFNKSLSDLLEELMQNATELSITHIEHLIHFSKDASPKFNKAAMKLAFDLQKKLLIFCQTKLEVLQELVTLFSLDESKIIKFIADEIDEQQEFCCHLLETKQFTECQPLMELLTSTFRTQHLKSVLRNSEIYKALKVLESGEILPEMIDLSKLTKECLHSRDLLSIFIQKGVSPCGHSGIPTPLVQLVKSLPKQVNRKNKYCEVVENIRLLVEAGANIEDINTLHADRETTPLHVATEMALVTEKFEILEMVHNKWSQDSSSKDGKGMTALHLLATMLESPINTLKIWEFLVCNCHVDISVYDNDNRTAAFYLSRVIKKKLKAKDIPYQAVEELQHSSIRIAEKPNFQSPEMAGPDEQSEIPTDKSEKQDDDAQSQTEDETLQPLVLPKYSEKETKKHFEQLFTQPDSYFLEEQQEITDEEPEITTQASSSSGACGTGMGSSIQSLPFDPNSTTTIWEVEVSEHFRKQIQDESICTKTTLSTIAKLAEGHFHHNTVKELRTKPSKPRIFKAQVNDTIHLLYTLMDRFSEEDTAKVRAYINKQIYVYKKTIIVLDIVKHYHDVSHAAERALRTIKTENNDRLEALPGKGHLEGRLFPQVSLRCKSEKINTEEREEIIKLLKNIDIEPLEGRKLELLDAKMYSLTTSLVLGLLDKNGERGDFPIIVTDDEFDIVEKPSRQPVVVLGRSGTGKTTVCLCRLWKVFFEYWCSQDRQNNPMIPKNEYLQFEDLNEEIMSIPKLSAVQIKSERQTTDSCEQERQFSATPDQTHQSEFEHIHQVFITKSGKLCDQMKERFYSFVSEHQFGNEQKKFAKKKLPKTFAEIDELHYPLFLTAKQFFWMLDKSIGDNQAYFQEDLSLESGKLQTINEIKEREEDEEDDKQPKRVEVTAEYFEKFIWPKLEKRAKGKIDPLLIWMEIQSYIKGSLQALESQVGILSEQEYEKFGKKRAPNFPMNRVEVYRIFKEYDRHLKHKDISKILFDNGDFIHNIHMRLKQKKHPTLNWSLHYVYIDEVQDFTQAELSVIVSCCKHPNGFFFAGDTAQTIIKGIAFRFEDLSSIFYSLGQQLKSKLTVNLPEKSMLTLNHRSHCRITNLGTTVTDLMKYFFPENFDWRNIPKDESSILDGPEPLFLCCPISELKDSFLKLNTDSAESVQFGANQAVIVRETENCSELREFLPDAIVLTVQQCKGLEFNDVFLYNFFTNFIKESEGPIKEIWRASATYLKTLPKGSKLNTPYMTKVHPLKFNERLHKTLCGELKYLYTVITRARCHLWIYESSPIDEILPMLDFWHRMGVVSVITDPTSEEQLN